MGISRLQRLAFVAFAVVMVTTLLARLYRSSQFKYNPVDIIPLRNDSNSRFVPGIPKPINETYTKTIVMARLKSEDVSWLYSELPEFNTSIYTMDDPDADLKVPRNKGREAMAYLTFIIEHYDNLPDIVLFFHPHRLAWHNNVLLDVDNVKTIQRLSPSRVTREGYFNSRCHHDPGCPNWLHIDRPKSEWDPIKKKEEQYLTHDVWWQIHPAEPLPAALSQPCCAQFAVSGERIRARPLSDYEHYRQWLLDTKIADEYSGRIMEYNWQYIFTGQSEFCPSQHQCYCDGYGICFGGTNDDNLQHWLDLLRKRELIEEDLEAWRKNAGEHQIEIAEAEVERLRLTKQIDTLKLEAYERGEDPRNRALECGRPWKDGDGF